MAVHHLDLELVLEQEPEHHPPGGVNLWIKYPDATGPIVGFRVIWSGTCINPTGVTGSTSPFSVDKTYDASPDAFNIITINELVTGLRPGTWKFTITTSMWSASCQQDVEADKNLNVNFTYLKGGCGTGLSFP